MLEDLCQSVQRIHFSSETNPLRPVPVTDHN